MAAVTKNRNFFNCPFLVLILKQQWTIEEISIFGNSSHLEWRAGLSDKILKHFLSTLDVKLKTR
jgi:hypothetical protein